MSRYKVIACVLLAALAGCGSDEAPTPPNQANFGPGVHAQLVVGGVRVTNGSSSAISFHVLNSYWLGLLVPCDHPQSRCASLDPGGRVVIPSDQIYGMSASPTNLVVRYWRAGDERPTEIPVAGN